ncbi:hypothetical protein AVEN_257810-1, partial [Araneus ventricosus]
MAKRVGIVGAVVCLQPIASFSPLVLTPNLPSLSCYNILGDFLGLLLDEHE